MRKPVRIVKVGGSLFTLPDLGTRIRCWLERQSTARHVLIAGGGALADVIREWDDRFHLGAIPAHWMCVDLLDISAQLLTVLLPEAALCRDWRELTFTEQTSSLVVFAPARFLRESEATMPGEPLPQSWEATSDSIAARLAAILGNTVDDDPEPVEVELVLLKSSLPPIVDDLSELGGPYLDAFFPWVACNLPRVRFVNLRDGDLPE